MEPENASATFQSYSYLYIVLVHWFANKNSEFLASPRSMELLAFLSKRTRLDVDYQSYGRTLVHELGLSGESQSDLLSLRLRVHSFSKAEHVLQTLLRTSKAPDNYQQSEDVATRLRNEWLGLAERPHIVQEALELLFATPDECKELDKCCNGDDAKAQACRRGAAALIGWFYAFLNTDNSTDSVAAESIAALALELASSLSVSALSVGSGWLQQKRPEFQIQTQLRIKIAWFWLLKCCFASADSIQNDAAVVDALESLEYAFRRFAPAKSKRCVLLR